MVDVQGGGAPTKEKFLQRKKRKGNSMGDLMADLGIYV